MSGGAIAPRGDHVVGFYGTTYGCRAHARRYVHKALESEPERTGYVLEQLKALYAIERTGKRPVKYILHGLRTGENLPACLCMDGFACLVIRQRRRLIP